MFFMCTYSAGYIGPVSIYTYFIVFAIINRFIIARLVKIIVLQEQYEGDFRYHQYITLRNVEQWQYLVM